MVGVEIFLSPFLKVLFDQLTPHARELWNLARNRGLEKKLEKLVQLFRSIEAVLADAEEQQMTKQAVKLWLDDLRDLAYDAEDVMDEFSTEALRLKVMEKQQATTCRFTPCALKFKYKMGSKIDAIVSRLREISERKDQLSLVANTGGPSESTHTWKPTPTTSTPIEVVVYGRVDDKKNVIDKLLNDDQNCNVIPIVAMGGAGKTTLAQHVYEDEVVAHAFESKAWVCVSTDFDVSRIMKAILVDVTSKPCDLKELQQIQARLKEVLNGKRFLIVLDDIWDHTFVYDKWLSIESLLRIGAPGSKMIVTTRQKEVAEKMGSTEPYMLKLLSDDDCWRLFKTHAFKKREDGLHPNLESIRKKIVERCDGLPLAARALGGLLRSKSSDSWEEMLNNKIWSLPEVRGGVLTVLKLSYYYLPPQLKKCFAYCAIFPQDYEFTEEELVLLWIGEGLIQQMEGRKQLIHEGHLYFSELVSRCLFQASSGNSSKFIMHDLVDELAKQVGGEIYVRLNDVEEFNENQERIKKVRHCSYLKCNYDTSKRFDFFHKAECLRTFRVSPHLQGEINCCFIANSVLHVLFRSSKLRILSFNGYAIIELPDSIGNLKYLRCLDLSSTNIKRLPKSTCSLYNLQILSLRDCSKLRELPSKIENLVNLCYLDITNADRLKEMPSGLKELKYLQVLSNFIVAKSNGCGLKELKNFKDLSGNLSLSNLENVVDAGEAMKASLNEKKNLEVLVLKWGSGLGDSRNVETETCVLDMLQPNQNLKELTIIGYGGNAFSTWLGDPLFSSVKMLKLQYCKLCTCLPPLGQLPSLKTLQIKGMNGVKSVGAEFYGNSHSKAFPSLESLSFEYMPEWENWSGFDVNEQAEGFSCLSVLSISYCPKLLGNLPNHLPSLKELEVTRCENLNVVISNFPKLYKLYIDGCLELISKSTPSTIESLTMKCCLAPGRFPTTLCSLTCLRKLRISGCSSVESLPSAIFMLPLLERVVLDDLPNLRIAIDEVNDDVTSGSLVTVANKELEINCCRSLMCISTRGILPFSLTNLEIRSCPRLEFVTETFLENTKLESIIINDCENFQRLAEGMWLLDNLKYIDIRRCPNLLSFPQGSLGSNKLEKLEISACKKLEALPDGIGNMTSLTRLDISYCEGIKFVGGDGEGLFTNLKELIIMGECPEMEGIPMKLPIHLVELYISYCEEMTRMPNIPITLTRLSIWYCPKLTTLPSNLSTSSSLINLDISDCGEMTTLPNPPLSLARLIIIECRKLISLPNLPLSLTELSIGKCPKLISLPNLPNNLIKLTIWWCEEMTSIPNIPNSLLELIIEGYPKLTTLPDLPISLIQLKISDWENLENMKSSSSSNSFKNLTSLEELQIIRCPKLKSLPKEGLPPSLLTLEIGGCPMLSKRCKRDKGKDWLKIAHIPYVKIDGNFIYDPDSDSDSE